MKSIFCLFVIFCGLATPAFASSGAEDPTAMMLFHLILLIVVAKLGGHVAATFHQPEVLGELIAGLVLGSLTLFGFQYFEFLRSDSYIAVLSEIGIILLLFEAGLETDLEEMKQLGWSSLLVATIGVIVPFFLGWGVAAYFMPQESALAHVFAGATLTATSVGITVRVLTDLNVMQRVESKIILGAAVIDDVLGLLVLAAVSSIIGAHNEHSTLNVMGIVRIIGSALLFMFLVVVMGRALIPYFVKVADKLKGRGMLLALSLLVCFGSAYLAYLFGLAPIVGAFAAGLILDAKAYGRLLKRSKYKSVHHLVHPITALMVPIFFVSMGAKVDVSVFGNVSILGFAFCLTLAAVLGKQACGLVVSGRGVDRVAVGLGMIPRGEVGLIFIGIGSKMLIDGVPVVDPATFGAVVIVVVVTTLITPSLVRWRFASLHDN